MSNFKNFIPFKVSPELLQELRDDAFGDQFAAELGKRTSVDPLPTQRESIGFVPPIGNELLFRPMVGVHVFAVQFNERVLPTKVVKEHLQKRIDAIGRKPTKGERKSMLEEVTFELLPKAFIRRTVVPVMLVEPGSMFVFASSPKRVDGVTAFLSNALDIFQRYPLQLVRTSDSPTKLLLNICTNSDSRFEALDAGVFKGVGKQTIRVASRDIYGDEVQALLKSGYVPHELRIEWVAENSAPILHFTLDNKLTFKRIEFPDVKLESVREAKENESAEYRAMCVLVSHHYRDLVDLVVTRLTPTDDDDEL